MPATTRLMDRTHNGSYGLRSRSVPKNPRNLTPRKRPRTSAPSLEIKQLFDHASFPHLLDQIIYHSAQSQRNILRQTSHAVRAIVDAYEVTQLCLHEPNAAADKQATAPVLCGYNDTPPEHLLSALSKTQTLDVFGVGHTRAMQIIALRAPNLRTVRLVPSRTGQTVEHTTPFAAPRLVVVTTPCTTAAVPHTYTRPNSSVQKLVYNICLPAEINPAVAQVRAWARGKALREVVIIIDCQLNDHTPSDVGELPPLGFLNTVARAVICDLGTTTVTFVNLLALPPSYLGLPADTPPPNGLKMVRSAFRQIIKEGHGTLCNEAPEMEMQDEVDRIGFLTLEEYKAKVGEESFRLEAVHCGVIDGIEVLTTL